jgi:nucleoside-triphosphatase THEP1
LLVSGVVCPPEFDGTKKTGIALRDLRGGENRELAQLTIPGTKGLHTHKWNFNEDTIRWGNVRLAKAIPCDVLVIDELGPLEFERGLGFLNGFTAVDSGLYQCAVIRLSLLEKAVDRWPFSQLMVVTPETRDLLADELVNSIIRL